MGDEELRRRRLEVLDAHFQSEVDHDWVACLATFSSHPRYEIEFDLLGTNTGEFLGSAPTGRSFRVPTIAVFFFDGDRITNERVYLDVLSLLAQIGRTDVVVPASGATRATWAPPPAAGTVGARTPERRTQHERRTEAERRLIDAAAELISTIGPAPSPSPRSGRVPVAPGCSSPTTSGRRLR